MSNAPKSSRDHMTATTEEGKIELTDEQLSWVTGSAGGRAVDPN